jgi:hypothetical protein
MTNLFQAPVPGQSLTDEPRNAAWENPPEIETMEEAVTYYIEKISDEDSLDDLALLFELGANVQDVTETLLIMGTMKGLHTVDVQMLAAPIVGAYIKAAMVPYGVETPETAVDPDKLRTERQKQRLDTIFRDAIEKSVQQGEDEGTELLRGMQDAVSEEPQEATIEQPMEETTEEPMVEGEAPQGLMARGQ